MKFETPYMEINMFDAEDMITASGTDFDAAVAEATKLSNQSEVQSKAVYKITF